MNCWELNQLTTPDQVAVKVKHINKVFILASVYMDGTHSLPPNQTQPLIDFANKYKLPLVIGSDSDTSYNKEEFVFIGRDTSDTNTNFPLL